MSLQSRISALITAVGTDIKNLQRPPLVSALPGSPVNGETVLFQTSAMKTAGVGPWRLRYDSSILAPYKWSVVSAQPLVDSTIVGIGTQIPTSAVGTVLETVNIPLPGNYVVDARMILVAQPGFTTSYMNVVLGSTQKFELPSDAPTRTPMGAVDGGIDLDTATTLSLRARVDATHPNATYYSRSLSALPLRVGPP